MLSYIYDFSNKIHNYLSELADISHNILEKLECNKHEYLDDLLNTSNLFTSLSKSLTLYINLFRTIQKYKILNQ